MKTKIYIKIGLVLIALTSCHILRKDKQTLKKLNNKEKFERIGQRTTKSQQSQLLFIDSINNDFTTFLWPKGKFKFSVANGFEGEAEKVLIKGNYTRQKIISDKQATKNDSSLLTLTYTNEKETSTVNSQKKISSGIRWGWLFILPLAFIAYYLIKKINFVPRA